jgi:hypothetical protein
MGTAGVDREPQRRAGVQQMVLTDELLERAGAQPGGEWRVVVGRRRSAPREGPALVLTE